MPWDPKSILDHQSPNSIGHLFPAVRPEVLLPFALTLLVSSNLTLILAEIYSHWKQILSNLLFSISCSKNVTFMDFCQKRVKENFRKFYTVMAYHLPSIPTTRCGVYEIVVSRLRFLKNFRKNNLLNWEFYCKIDFTKLFSSDTKISCKFHTALCTVRKMENIHSLTKKNMSSN